MRVRGGFGGLVTLVFEVSLKCHRLSPTTTRVFPKSVTGALRIPNIYSSVSMYLFLFIYLFIYSRQFTWKV